MVEGLNAVSLSALSRVDFGHGAQPGQTAAVAPGSFGEILTAQMNATIGSVHNAEVVSARALTGDADIRAVTDAVMEAERHLQAAVAIRDKIVTAYLDMSRMAI